jgi:hypothetical protein
VDIVEGKRSEDVLDAFIRKRARERRKRQGEGGR